MTGHRMSSLPIARYCGQAPRVSELAGSGRSAIQSTAFHALCAGADAKDLLALLTEDEITELRTWHKPATVVVDGVTLDYESADKELAVALDPSGYGCDPDVGEVLSLGHLDMAWIRETSHGKTAFIGDIKRSSFTTVDGPSSLQLAAYGCAYADLRGAAGFVPGLWIAQDSEWIWGDFVDLREWGGRGDNIRSILVAAAKNAGDYCLGAHCRGCYGRLKCPAYESFALIPVSERTATMATLGAFQDVDLTPARAAEAVLMAQAAADLSDRILQAAKEFVRRGGVIVDPKTGKHWEFSSRKGREYVNVGDLRKALGPEADAFIKTSKESEVFSWKK